MEAPRCFERNGRASTTAQGHRPGGIKKWMKKTVENCGAMVVKTAAAGPAKSSLRRVHQQSRSKTMIDHPVLLSLAISPFDNSYG
ncbi:hypothetical protein NOVOSPHI9U_290013 [Novosphingobium sp. 9U]|nr:hypothetical protein NOVOSPHI9U_290013 [Novosphingobium sp. 9U]